MKRILSIILVLAIMVGSFIGFAPAKESEAASKTITVKAFNTLFKKSIKNKDARALLPRASAKAITRLEAARILAQAYEILNPKKVASDEDVATVAALRINEVNEKLWSFTNEYGNITDESYTYAVNPDYVKLSDKDKSWFTKAYMYGLITATSWETGAHMYKFSPNAKMTKADAKASIKALKSAKKAYKLSPDWQMIRTTNLPEQAEFFPYVLTTFPNEYYDAEFMFTKDLECAVDTDSNSICYDAYKDTRKEYSKLKISERKENELWWDTITNKKNKDILEMYNEILAWSCEYKKMKYGSASEEYKTLYDKYPTKKAFLNDNPTYGHDKYLSYEDNKDVLTFKYRLGLCLSGRPLLNYAKKDAEWLLNQWKTSVSPAWAAGFPYSNKTSFEIPLWEMYLSPAELYKVKNKEYFQTLIGQAYDEDVLVGDIFAGGISYLRTAKYASGRLPFYSSENNEYEICTLKEWMLGQPIPADKLQNFYSRFSSNYMFDVSGLFIYNGKVYLRTMSWSTDMSYQTVQFEDLENECWIVYDIDMGPNCKVTTENGKVVVKNPYEEGYKLVGDEIYDNENLGFVRTLYEDRVGYYHIMDGNQSNTSRTESAANVLREFITRSYNDYKVIKDMTFEKWCEIYDNDYLVDENGRDYHSYISGAYEALNRMIIELPEEMVSIW